MPKCVYCGSQYEFPRGLTLIKKDGTINYLCSSKCQKNMLMKRRKVRWILKSVQPRISQSAEEMGKKDKTEDKVVKEVKTEKKVEKKVKVEKK